jgi:hypothetical protein
MIEPRLPCPARTRAHRARRDVASYAATWHDWLRSEATSGGRFLYDASPRCPSCRSTAEMWDADESQPTVTFD